MTRATGKPVEYVEGANLGDIVITWIDTNGDLRDFSSGWTITAIVYPWNGLTRSFAKLTGVTGGGAEPNVTIVWSVSGEVKTLTAGVYKIEVVATDGAGKVAKMEGLIQIRRGAPAA